MAHQKWNDDTDRSTLPIHGAITIGYREGGTKPDSCVGEIFFANRQMTPTTPTQLAGFAIVESKWDAPLAVCPVATRVTMMACSQIPLS